ncbi:MAG: dephospho-CoA kinase [Pseudomonadota bacterium]
MSLRIGLTGGIGSGKSTVARMLLEYGAALVDADEISRGSTASGGLAIPAILEQFGPRAIMPDGAMNRDVMRQLVFSDPAVKSKLESIIHPLVSKESERQAAAASAAGQRCIVFDIPLLVESGRWRQQLDHVLVVDCRETTQISRVVSRSGWTPEAVQKVMAGQAGRAQRRAAGDTCLYNDGLTLEGLSLLLRQLAVRFGL